MEAFSMSECHFLNFLKSWEEENVCRLMRKDMHERPMFSHLMKEKLTRNKWIHWINYNFNRFDTYTYITL